MASAEATLSVGDVAAMNDAELAQFMQKHRLPDGDYDLPVHGWDKLSRDERSRLAERLEAQKRSLAQSPTACSRPLDLDDLDARLRQVSPRKSFSLRPETQAIDRSRSPTPPIDRTRLETEAYHELVNVGGRPLYPIALIQDVYRDPDNYAEILRPWQETLTQIRAEGVFQRQLQRWQDFRKWQDDNRASGWDVQQSLRERQRRLCRERGCRGLRDYAEAVKRRLARHGFTQPFELDEDPKKQDKLTTWIEYLNYEYWWLDKYAGDVERLEPEHDRLWQELANDKVLRPHETKEFVRTTASPMERQNEEDMARKVVQRAESEAKRIYVLTQEDPKRFGMPRAKRISMLRVGSEKLLAVKRQFEQIRGRNNRIGEFIRGTFGYAGARRNAARHRILVQWVLDQIPLVKAEMEQSKVNRSKHEGGRRAKRRLAIGEDFPEKQPTRRVRLGLGEPRLAVAKASSEATETQLEPRIVMDREAAEGSRPGNLTASYPSQDVAQAMSQGPRRSARIAARRDASGVALQPHIAELRSRSRSDATVARPLRHGSPVGDVKGHTLLCEKGADVNAKGAEGITASREASLFGFDTIVQFLLNQDAQIDMRNDDGDTALHLASATGHTAIVERLLEKGADVNGRGKHKDSDHCLSAPDTAQAPLPLATATICSELNVNQSQGNDSATQLAMAGEGIQELREDVTSTSIFVEELDKQVGQILLSYASRSNQRTPLPTASGFKAINGGQGYRASATNLDHGLRSRLEKFKAHLGGFRNNLANLENRLKRLEVQQSARRNSPTGSGQREADHGSRCSSRQPANTADEQAHEAQDDHTKQEVQVSRPSPASHDPFTDSAAIAEVRPPKDAVTSEHTTESVTAQSRQVSANQPPQLITGDDPDITMAEGGNQPEHAAMVKPSKDHTSSQIHSTRDNDIVTANHSSQLLTPAQDRQEPGAGTPQLHLAGNHDDDDGTLSSDQDAAMIAERLMESADIAMTARGATTNPAVTLPITPVSVSDGQEDTTMADSQAGTPRSVQPPATPGAQGDVVMVEPQATSPQAQPRPAEDKSVSHTITPDGDTAGTRATAVEADSASRVGIITENKPPPLPASPESPRSLFHATLSPADMGGNLTLKLAEMDANNMPQKLSVPPHAKPDLDWSAFTQELRRPTVEEVRTKGCGRLRRHKDTTDQLAKELDMDSVELKGHLEDGRLWNSLCAYLPTSILKTYAALASLFTNGVIEEAPMPVENLVEAILSGNVIKQFVEAAKYSQRLRNDRQRKPLSELEIDPGNPDFRPPALRGRHMSKCDKICHRHDQFLLIKG
ncbi:hypothetical protein MKZ38_004389 [Zalerion maritima]|uniref:Ankyrin repeat protein n=1 Tax=Zalerion maritima TaxID=339359 RepID=A0AAD5RMJ3_9PEZI|nr:hypothetical protein MKZ38_004389 [Zalerion maritima]